MDWLSYMHVVKLCFPYCPTVWITFVYSIPSLVFSSSVQQDFCSWWTATVMLCPCPLCSTEAWTQRRLQTSHISLIPVRFLLSIMFGFAVLLLLEIARFFQEEYNSPPFHLSSSSVSPHCCSFFHSFRLFAPIGVHSPHFFFTAHILPAAFLTLLTGVCKLKWFLFFLFFLERTLSKETPSENVDHYPPT